MEEDNNQEKKKIEVPDELTRTESDVTNKTIEVTNSANLDKTKTTEANNNHPTRKKRTKISSYYKESVVNRKKLKKIKQELIENRKDSYSFVEAFKEIEKITSYSRMNDQTLSMHINTTINASKSDQNINTYCDVPHYLKIKRSVLVVSNDKINATNNITVISPQELSNVITKKSALKYTKILTNQDCMGVFLKHARIIGPRGLLPNIKSGTITNDLNSLAQIILKKRVFIKNDKGGVFHIPIGKVSLKVDHLLINAKTIIKQLNASRPSKIAAVGFITAIHLCSTNSPSLPINHVEMC